MFVIQDGRECFYQWDIDRKLIVKDSSIKQVHFCNKTEECSLVCATYQENGETLVNVPNILLQNDWKINVYGYTGDYTKHSDCFKVVKRSKPSDYIYTETEILTYQKLEDRIYDLETTSITYELMANEVNTIVEAELETQIAEKGFISMGDVRAEGFLTENDISSKIIINYDLIDEGYARGMIDNSLEDYATKAQVEELVAEKTYELIQKFTLTEETKTIELDGFDLDKYVLYITSPKSDVEGGCSYQVFKDTKCVYSGWVNQIISKADNGTSMLTGKNENGMAFIAAFTSNYSYKNPLITPKYIEGINPFTKIKLIVNTTSAYNFQVGAKIELWGVRH